jgi:hypothetical protein
VRRFKEQKEIVREKAIPENGKELGGLKCNWIVELECIEEITFK